MFSIIPTKYKYNKENCTTCSIYKDGYCRFSPLFRQGCKEGRAMWGCNKCKIKDNEIIFKYNNIKE